MKFGGWKMTIDRDIEFFEVVVGVVIVFIPIILTVTLSPSKSFNRTALLGFNIASIITGMISGFLILDGYYKLTDKLKVLG